MSRTSINDCTVEACVEPAEAFALVGNETRLRILEALWEAPERPVSFSELRKAVEMRDSAQFNYHLGKLTDHFVRKTEDGYDFQYAGEKVVRAVLAGTFNENPVIPPFEIDGDCSLCGEGLHASYADETITVECPDCGHLHGRYPFPPGGLKDRSREEIMDAFNQRVRHLHCLAADGVCPECNGRMVTTMTREDDMLGLELRVDHNCEQCRHHLYSAVGLKLLDQSDVVTFYRDHGVDLCTTPFWNLDWCVTDQHTTVRGEDPWRVQVSIPLDEEVLSVTLDGDLSVLDVERGPAPTRSDTAGLA